MSSPENEIQEVKESSTTFEEDLQTFNELSSKLADENKGKFLLVKNGLNQGIFSNFVDAHKEAVEKFGTQDVVIGQIGVPQPLNFIASVV